MGNRGKQEVEIKFRISDLPALRRALRSGGFREQTRRTPETNILLDNTSRSVAGRGEVLRIRKYGKVWTLTHKSRGIETRHKVREETETIVGDGDALAKVFSSLGFEPTFRYEKFRSEWTDGKGKVLLDETPIGNFGEIEGAASWIDRTAKKLGLTPADYITDSYVALFYKWKDKSGSGAADMTWAAVKGG